MGEVGDVRLVVVDKVAKARRIDDRQPEPDAVLLDVSRRARHADGARELGPGRGVRAGRVNRRREEGVDQGRLAEAGFACSRGKVRGERGELGCCVDLSRGTKRKEQFACLVVRPPDPSNRSPGAESTTW